MDKVQSLRATSLLLRTSRPHNFMANYSPISTWIPSKLGLSYTYSPSSLGSWELNLNRGSFSIPFFIEDLGSINEYNASILYRSYSHRHSFSVIYGINYYTFSAKLGSKYLSSIIIGDPMSYDALKVKSLGLVFGLGNLWQLKRGLSFGVDWFTINVPIHVTQLDADYLNSSADQEDKNDVKNVLDVLKRVPTFSLLNLKIGYSF